MNYLLDTNAWLRLFQWPEELSPAVREMLSAESQLGLSPFSLLEVSQKHHKSDLGLNMPLERWFELAAPPNLFRILPLTAAICARAYTLGPGFHGDPADRVIVATCLEHKVTLVTSDKRLLDFPGLTVVSTR